MAHMSRHPFALEHAARGGGGTVRTLMAMELGTMGHRTSVLAIPLHGALEAFSLGDRGGIDLIARGEDVGLDLILYGVLLGVLKTELPHEPLIRDPGFIKMAL